jgi:hypothetical protein
MPQTLRIAFPLYRAAASPLERRAMSASSLALTSRRGRALTLLLARSKRSTFPSLPKLFTKTSRVMRRIRLRTVAPPATLPRATVRRPPLIVASPYAVQGPELTRNPSCFRRPNRPEASRLLGMRPGLYCESVSPLGATSFQHFTTVGRAHPLEEPMAPLPLASIRLIGSFHSSSMGRVRGAYYCA